MPIDDPPNTHEAEPSPEHADDPADIDLHASDFGKLTFTVAAEPVSIQSKSTARDVFDDKLKGYFLAYDFLIDSEVTLTVHWWGSPRRRWETDEYPDLDNWLKPLIDSFVGPDRLLIDDAQVKSIEVTFHEARSESSRIDVEVVFVPGRILPKNGLRYVQLEGALCYPIIGNDPAQIAWQVTAANTQLSSYHEGVARGIDRQQLFSRLSSGFIHRTRLGSAFDVIRAKDLPRAGDQ